ncbi:MAG: glycosyl hydrolase family 32 [Clostridiales bacterium]|nr:glycosyl hydrolase family 32 [Clostridiales bacterium]
MEKLYNNIILPDDFASKPSCPNDVPYLKNPPEVINVSVGRQLFVDDFLIEETDLEPEYHKAKKFDGNPVLSPETEWERGKMPAACPKSGGVWFDEDERIYKMWYEAGWLGQICYAISHDGINWERPNLDIEPGTNKILTFDSNSTIKDFDPKYLKPDSTTFWIDHNDLDKSRRYKMYLRNPGGPPYPGIIGTSPDGIHWENLTLTTNVGDRSTIFYNPFRRKWVYSIRSGWSARSRQYHECDDLFEGAHWNPNEAAKWLSADELDLPNPYIRHKPELYNVDVVGYESIMLGMFEIFYGPENNFCGDRGVPKITELIPMYSRDGYNFSRPSREPIIGSSICKGSWDRGYVQSVGGVTIIHGDELWIYYIGFGGDERFGRWYSDDDMETGMYMNGATGIAKLRRDGFVSLNGCGSILTRRLEFTSKCELHVNIDGRVKVAIIGESGEVIAESLEFSGDSTNVRLDFGSFDIASLEGKPFRLRFDVDGKLYSFGFTDMNGDFGGAHAAGIAE